MLTCKVQRHGSSKYACFNEYKKLRQSGTRSTGCNRLLIKCNNLQCCVRKMTVKYCAFNWCTLRTLQKEQYSFVRYARNFYNLNIILSMAFLSRRIKLKYWKKVLNGRNRFFEKSCRKTKRCFRPKRQGRVSWICTCT